MIKYGMLIGGELVGGRRSHVVHSPHTGMPFAEIAWATGADADAALDAAHAAFESWSQTSVGERVRLMHALRAGVAGSREELSLAVSREMGKTAGEADDDVQSLLDSLTYYADEIAKIVPEVLPDRDQRYRHELRPTPVGVVVAFLAWNFPILNLGFKMGPALASGCPIVVKPSPKSPVSAYIVGRLCLEAGIPAGVVNIICGPDEEVSTHLASSKLPALLTLIGSAETAKKIVRSGSTSIKRYSLELGGNAPFLVFADCDLTAAVATLTDLKFGNAGQICVAPNRVLVDQSIAARFVEAVAERARAIALGVGEEGQKVMGPVIDGQTVKRLTASVNDAVHHGARLVTGGQAGSPGHPDLKGGSFFEPTVLEGVRAGMNVYDSEIFGPIVGVSTFSSEDEALRLANATDSGLVAYLFTKDRDRQDRLSQRLRFGEVQVNGARYAIDLPHGGIKQSGYGHDCSALALRDYLAVKRVTTVKSSDAVIASNV